MSVGDVHWVEFPAHGGHAQAEENWGQTRTAPQEIGAVVAHVPDLTSYRPRLPVEQGSMGDRVQPSGLHRSG